MELSTVSKNKSYDGIQGVYRHQSESTRCEMEFSLYEPSKKMDGGNPVLFYLSGLTCTQENATTKAGFQQFANHHGFVVVCPDTSPRDSDHPGEHEDYDLGSGAGFYLNATQSPWSNNYHMYDYIVDELWQLVENNFSVNLSRCGIFGHSMGGHGALTIGLKNPRKFRSISAFSPIVAPSQCPWGVKALSAYLGEDQQAWQEYDATALIQKGLKSSNKILIDQGNADNFLDEQLKPNLFQKACEDAGQAVELRMQPGYDHSYFFISSFMEQHIRFHAHNLE